MIKPIIISHLRFGIVLGLGEYVITEAFRSLLIWIQFHVMTVGICVKKHYVSTHSKLMRF